MKARKFLAGLAMTIIVLFGAFSPVVDIVMQGHPNIASAQSAQSAHLCDFSDVTCSLVKYTVNILSAPFIAMSTIGGLVLDYSIWTTVSSDSYTDKDETTSFVVRGWKLVRDFSNLVFIFGLFVAAFVLILGKSEGGESLYNPKRLVARVLIMALFINFSFFMCRSIIDVTNIVARAFYTQIATDNDATTANAQQTTQASSNGEIQSADLGNVSGIYSHKNLIGIRSVSLGILSKIQLQDLILKAGGGDAFSTGNYGQVLITYVMVAIFNGFLAFLFLSSAIFLFSRTIGLWFLMILSPIAFASRVIPALQKKEYFGWDDWFSQFVGLASSVVVYLFFIYLAVVFLNVGVNDVVDTESSGFLAVTFAVGIKLLSVGIVLTLGKTVAKDLSGKIGAMAAGAVNSAIVGGAMVVGAAATGGAAGVLQMGRRYASDRAKVAGVGIGNSVLGEEATAEFQKRWGTGGIKNFNPLTMQGRKAISKVMEKRPVEEGSLGAMSRSISGAYRSGGAANRLFDIKQAKEAAEKAKIEKTNADKVATKSVDKKIEDIKKDFENNVLNKNEFNEELKKLQKEKKDILKPPGQKLEEEKITKDLEAAQANQDKSEKEKTAGITKLADINKKLTDVTTSVTENNQKLANIGNDLVESQKTILEKQAAVTVADTNHQKTLNSLTTSRDVAKGNLQSVDKELTDLDRQITLIGPGAGFETGRQMKDARDKILERKKAATDALNSAESSIGSLSTSHTSNLATLNKEYSDAVAANKIITDQQKNAENSLAAAQAEKKKLEDQDIPATQAQIDSASEKITLAQGEVSRLTTELDSSKRKYESKEVTSRITKRTSYERSDTNNRDRNNQKVSRLTEYLDNIANGGPIDVMEKTDRAQREAKKPGSGGTPWKT